jgi:hydrogenase-4 component E
MPNEIFAKLANLLSVLALGATILLTLRRGLPGQIRLFVLQSLALATLAAVVGLLSGSVELMGVALVVLLLKCIVIPRVLRRVAAKLGSERSALTYAAPPLSLGICGLLLVLAFYVMAPVAESNPLPTAGAIPLAFATVLIGLFTTVNRRRALSQILGFLTLENGIFLLALLATYGVPFIIEIGVFLDVLVAVLIMEVFVYRIKESFDTVDVGQLGELKG